MKLKWFYLITILSLGSFSLLLQKGIFSMHDFHPFRLFEFKACMDSNVFPCRWSANSTLGYGQPMFNFYGQLVYWVGYLFMVLGLGVLDSVKAVFAISLLLSGLFMYLFSRRYFGDTGGLISGVFYIYAPYRAVDVWVRGALPESFAFVFYPLILLLLEILLERPTTRRVGMLSLAISGLIVTHNLSTLMFAPFVAAWILVRFLHPAIKALPYLCLTGILSFGLSGFYLVPVLLESNLTSLSKITENYFEYGSHFTTLYRLFISPYWGYGGSIWGPNQYMSFSAGYLHWIVPTFLFVLLIIFRIKSVKPKPFIISFMLGVLALFMTHGKSNIIWQAIPALSYIQFPWRYLSISTFFLSLSAGFIYKATLSKKLVSLSIVAVICLNAVYFFPDKWIYQTDTEYFSGDWWEVQRSSAISDYWPLTAASVPNSSAPNAPMIVEGKGEVTSIHKLGHRADFELSVDTSSATVKVPIVYFPGWVASSNGSNLDLKPSGEFGEITFVVPKGVHAVQMYFSDSTPRKIGNSISMMSLVAVALFVAIQKKYV